MAVPYVRNVVRRSRRCLAWDTSMMSESATRVIPLSQTMSEYCPVTTYILTYCLTVYIYITDHEQVPPYFNAHTNILLDCIYLYPRRRLSTTLLQHAHKHIARLYMFISQTMRKYYPISTHIQSYC